MAERHRSKDGVKETDKYISEADDIDHQGRSGGGLQRDVGTQDEEKQVVDKPGADTRVTGEDKRNHGEDACPRLKMALGC